MKSYRPVKHMLGSYLRWLKKHASLKASKPLQYMDVKEMSELMERARTSAQFAVLRYKYDALKNRAAREQMERAIEIYRIAKENYYSGYHAYLQQCQKMPATPYHVANNNLYTPQKTQRS